MTNRQATSLMVLVIVISSLVIIIYYSASETHEAERTDSLMVDSRVYGKNEPPPKRSTPQSRESFLVQFFSAHKKADMNGMNTLCRKNPEDANWAMTELGKLVIHFDELDDHPALLGTEIGGESVSPSELRLLVRDLERSLGPVAEKIKTRIAKERLLSEKTHKNNKQEESEEWTPFIESFKRVDKKKYNEFLKEFAILLLEDQKKAQILAKKEKELIPSILNDYFELLRAMAAHTNMESISFKWSGRLSWNVPKLFGLIASLAIYHSQASQNPASKLQAEKELEKVVTMSLQAAESAEVSKRFSVAIDKYLHVIDLAELYEIPKIAAVASEKLSRLYYKQGDSAKALQFAKKAKSEPKSPKK